MFINLEQAKNLIREGRILHIAAEESLLNQLPKGKWNGGNTPYFITEHGGITSTHKLFVNEFASAVDFKTEVYG